MSNGHRPLTRAPHLRYGGPPRTEAGPPFIDRDSCYGSSDEVSHASLSRESSDPDKTGSTSTLRPADIPEDLVTFTTRIGYTIDDLETVMRNVTICDKDQLLTELVKLGRPNEPGREAPIETRDVSNLRPIVIDGSNIAMTHGRKEVFSCLGIRSTVDFFVRRGHKDILVFIPQHRKETPRCDSPITDQHILFELDEEKRIVWTPSRNVNGRRVTCHDDRYILKTAIEKDAVVVSNDEYRDLLKENPQYKRLVESRQLMYSFVDGRFMPPDDPCGRNGPTLERFLSKLPNLPGAQQCPYARKCTYGNKCKYYHPERANGGHLTVTERLFKENQKKCLSPRSSMQLDSVRKHNSLGRTQSLNMNVQTENIDERNQPLNKRHLQLTAANSAPWAVQQQQQQQPVGRIHSMPLSPLNQQQLRNSNSQLFAPSTAVWGHSELSVGPLNTSTLSDQEDTSSRAHLQHHLCCIFPETVVVAVMAANPQETRRDVLCKLVLARLERTEFEFHNSSRQ